MKVDDKNQLTSSLIPKSKKVGEEIIYLIK